MSIRSLHITLRHLWRNRLFTLLNVAGLSIGLSAAWVVWQYANFEMSHNTRIDEASRLYRVVSHFVMEDGTQSVNAGCPEPLGRATEIVAGIEKTIPVVDLWTLHVLPEGAKKPINEPDGVEKTIPAYFDLLPYQWLAGSRTKALTQPNEVVLTRSKAELYFPRLQPADILGQKLDYYFFEDTVSASVVGIVEDLDFPSSFVGKDFISLPKPKQDEWTNTNSSDQLWVLLDKNADPKTVEAALNEVSDQNSKSALGKWKMQRSLSLQPLSQVHFDADFVSHLRTASPEVIGILPAVAVFLLLLACINYVNLSTAQIPLRAREIGVRKTLGSSRKNLLFGFLGETLLVCLLATGVAALLTQWAFVFFEKDLPEDVLTYADTTQTALFLGILVGIVTLASGLYPGWLIGRSQAASLLNGSFFGQNQSKNTRAGLRKSLIVFQFFIAQIFIIGALVVGRQLDFMLQKDLGFDREAVLVATVPFKTAQNPAFAGKEKVLAEALRKLPEVADLSLGEPLFSGNYSSNTSSRTTEKGEKIERSLYRKRSDGHLTEFYRVPVLAGRAAVAAGNTSEIVINASAVHSFGFETPQAAIGQTLAQSRGNGPSHTIVGVVADFHTGDFSKKIEATAFFVEPELRTLNIRLSSRRPGDWSAAASKIAAEWGKIYPDDPFEGRFYDETMREIYAADLSAARLVNACTSIAILISCLGLFGLATFMAFRRTKEIGIRKTLGASAQSIVGLLSKEFLWLVGIGFVLAVPIAVYFLRHWLNDFAYRVDLEWWVVLLAGAISVLLAFLTVGYQSIKAALTDPVKSLRNE